jgi:hypothetical protein
VITRKAKPGEVRHAEVRSGERRVRLIAILTPDGWLAHVYDIDAKNWEHQGEWPDPEGAVGQLESYARHVLNVAGPIDWSDDPI